MNGPLPGSNGVDIDDWQARIPRDNAGSGISSEISVGTASTGMYVHVPYCSTRCGYCDFNTYTPSEIDLAASEYAQVAVAEIDLASRVWNPTRIDTIFIGGGTPTLLAVDDIDRIIDAISTKFGLASDAEITIEANPDSVTRDSLASLKAAGVTRVSFGVQSLATHVLAVLERTHTPGRALEAIAQAREVGFEHVSADLIYATASETDADVVATVRAILDAGVDHLSAYSLIVEPGTRLARQVDRGLVAAPDEDIAADRYLMIDEHARAGGLQWYEVSNWAKPGGECRHNMGYWRGTDWWAIGPGAHGHIRAHMRDENSLRWWNVKHPRAHADAVAAGRLPVAGWETIDPTTQALEALMLGLRLREGIPRVLLAEDAQPVLDALSLEGWVRTTGDRVHLTDSGRLVADRVVRDLAEVIAPA